MGGQFEDTVLVIQLMTLHHVVIPVLLVMTFYYFKSEFDVFGLFGGPGYIAEEKKENLQIVEPKKGRYYEHQTTISILMIVLYLTVEDTSSQILYIASIAFDFFYYSAKIIAAN